MKKLSLIFVIALGWCSAVFSAAGQETAANDEEQVEKRVEFLQHNFSKFVPMPFRKGTNSEAAIQILPVKENRFEYDGAYYCGFKFTVPEWIDGDFKWMYILAKTKANKDFSTSTLNWYIIPETGRSPGFQYFDQGGFSRYPWLKAQFPYTRQLTMQDLDQQRLIPGKTYGIWFGFKEPDMPDIAFAMTIGSERGIKEFGVLPLR